MNMLRSLIVAALLALGLATPAYSQCSGQFANNTFCGYTGGAAKGLPVPTTVPAGSLSPIAAYTVLGNPTGSTATPIATTQPILRTTGTEGVQLTAQSSSATTGRAGIIVQNTNGGGGLSIQQNSAGNVYIQNAGTANTIDWFDAAGNNYLRYAGGAALANTRVSVLSTQTSTSSTTGALTVAGGIGTTGPVFVSGNVVVGSTGGGGTLFFGNNTGTGQISALAVNNTDNALYMYSRGTGGIRWQNLANTQTIMSLSDGGVLTLTQGVASTSTSTGTLVINGSGGLGVGGNIYGGTALRVGTDPSGGAAFDWINAGAATSAASIAFGKTRDATNPKAYRFYDVGGLTGDAVGAAFWRGTHFVGPTITDPSGGANVFPTASLFYEFNSLATPSTRNFVLDIGNTTSTTASTFVLRQNGTALLSANGTSVSIPLATASSSSTTGALVVTGGVGVGGSIFAAGNATVSGLEVTTGDVYISRTSSATGYITRPNSVGFKNLTFAVSGGGPLDLVTANTAVLAVTGSTASSSTITGAVTVVGGVGIGGNLNVGGNLTAASITGTVNISGLTANRLVATDGSSNLTSTITSANMAASISDETGSGSAVFATSPTLVTPVLGVATATSINKVAITAPATSATLTIANGKTLTASNTLTFTGTDGSSVAFGTGGTVTYTVASGTSALGTSAISAGTCATVVTTAASGTATTDVVDASFNGDPTAVTGYTPGAMLSIVSYPSANNVNFKVCNNTSGSITPGAITLNWKVRR